MKKISTFFLMSILTFSAYAQQIPNSNFEQWERAGSSYQSSNGTNPQRPDNEPAYWEGSSVNQTVSGVNKQSTLITSSTSYNGTNAVRMENKWVGAKILWTEIGDEAPGFISFATPWVYAVTNVGDCDGGVYGGMNFSYRPDAIKGHFKRSGGTGEKAHIIVYLWKGTFKNAIKSDKNNDVQNNTDRAVMGRVTSTDSSGKRIASCDYEFTSTNDWEEITIPLSYNGDEVPEMANVILSSGDYWNRNNIIKGSILEADDVQFVYYSELTSLKYDGVEYFKNGQTSYTIDRYFNESKLSLVSNGKGAKFETKFDGNTGLLTITVKGDDFNVNRDNKHEYTVRFKESPKSELASLVYDGNSYFLAGATQYRIDEYYDESKLQVTSNGADATIEKSYDENTSVLTITIKGSDYAENNSSKHVYKIQFKLRPGVAYSDLASLVYDGKNYFEIGKIAYVIDAVYEAEKLKVTSNGADAIIEKNFNETSCVLTITIKGWDIDENPSNKHVYLVAFKKGTVVPTPEPEPGSGPNTGTDPVPGDYTPRFTGEKTTVHDNRWINSVVVSSPTYNGYEANRLSVDNGARVCYNDYTGTVTMKALAGEIVTMDVEIGQASWMNAYVYIDTDSDGFTAEIDQSSNWKPAGDMVAYSYYNNNGNSDENGWNSAGTSLSGDGRSTVALPSFAMPEKGGVYRMRVKLDWCNIDPYGDVDGKFGDFMDNGGQIVDFMIEVVEPDHSMVDYTPAFTSEKTRLDRWIQGITLLSEEYDNDKLNVDNTSKLCYNDYTETVTMKAAPGETVEVDVELSQDTYWMNTYVYIDTDFNGFTAGIVPGSDWEPAGDMVAYSYYNNDGDSDENGWDSEGTSLSGDRRNTVVLPSFTAPEKPGVYRMRVKIDWCNIDPNGDADGKFKDFEENGGQIVDFLIEVAENDNSLGIEDVEDTEEEQEEIVDSVVEGIYDMQGRKLEEITKPGLYIINGKKVYVKM
ncbi:MAG: hypothetical protein J6V20_00425 [Bacteroidaceae bacterium]|nr:hypothetical protein [Bacteroidaceae bacterium]